MQSIDDFRELLTVQLKQKVGMRDTQIRKLVTFGLRIRTACCRIQVLRRPTPAAGS